MVGGNTPLPGTPQVQAMKKYGMTEEEIFEVLAFDREIDRGAKLFELDKELRAGAKKARRADRTNTPKPRERKTDKDRHRLIEFFKNALENEINLPLTETDFIGATVEIINPEREFLFTYNGKKYKVVLSCPRS